MVEAFYLKKDRNPIELGPNPLVSKMKIVYPGFTY